MKIISLQQIQQKPLNTFKIIDVRSSKEFLKGHIPNAFHIPHDYFTSHTLPQITQKFIQLSIFPNDNECIDKLPLLFHCRLSLIRSPDTITHLKKLIFQSKDSNTMIWKNVEFYLLQGGFKEWELLNKNK